MRLDDIIQHPISSREHLERYVNDGSPSGFSTVYTTSNSTSPFELTPWFRLYKCIGPAECFRQFGSIPYQLEDHSAGRDNWILVHPDMVANAQHLGRDLSISICEEINVAPTASGRTVQIISDVSRDYIKLHYEGILGRVRRELPYRKAISGPEVSRIIVNAIDARLLDANLSLLPEPGARVLTRETPNGPNEWGMVWRQNAAYGLLKADAMYLFPAFSLFSTDRLAIYHFPLLKQIIDRVGVGAEEYVFGVLIEPLIACYFNMIQKLGLQPEWNSQNLLFGFNADFTKAKFVMRDLESIDKDLGMMDVLNIDYDFQCYPYKCLETTQYNYFIKHSFMFDFKLGECILEPLLVMLSRYYASDIRLTRDRVKEITRSHIAELPEGFFPEGRWYVFDRVLVDQSVEKRPYLEIENPKFRD